MPAALLTCLLFGATAVCARRSALWLGSTRANLFRLALAALLLALWAHGPGEGWSGQPRYFLAAGAVGFGLGGFAMFQALPRLGSSLAMLIVQCGAAVAATVLAWVFGGEALTAAELLASGVVLLGVALGLTPAAPAPAVPGPRWGGVAWALVSALAQGASLVVSRQGMLALVREGVRPSDFGWLLTAAYQRLAGGLAVAALLYGVWWGWGRWRSRHGPAVAPAGRPVPLGRWDHPALWVVANTLLGPVLGVSAWLYAASQAHPGIVQTLVAASPLVSIPLARPLGEPWPRPRYYLGVALALGGMAGLVMAR